MRTSSRKIRSGVIGYGGTCDMGKLHLGEMRQAGMLPCVVVDVDPSRLKEAARDFPGIATFSSIDAMLRSADVDLLTVITPHNTHASIALRCLAAGKHVVCEKPMAITTAECDRMMAAARKRRLMLSAYHNRHWDGCVLGALQKIRSGAIGEVVRVDAHMGQWEPQRDWWRSSKSISGGILYDWGVHLLEYTLQLVDSPIVEVSGFTRRGVWAATTAWKKDTIEDEGYIVVRYGSGAWSTLLMTSIDAAPRPGWLHVTGTRGTLEFDGGGWTLTTPGGGTTPRVGTTRTIRGRNPPDRWREYYRNVVAHLTRGAKLVITPEWARRPIHVIDLAYRSAARGAALKARYS